MKAIVCTGYGPPEVLQLREVEEPTPKHDQVISRSTPRRPRQATPSSGPSTARPHQRVLAPRLKRASQAVAVGPVRQPVLQGKWTISEERDRGEVSVRGATLVSVLGDDRVFAPDTRRTMRTLTSLARRSRSVSAAVRPRLRPSADDASHPRRTGPRTGGRRLVQPPCAA